MEYEQIKNRCIALGVAEDSDELHEILGFYKDSKRAPTASEINFVRAALRKASEVAKGKIRLREAKCVSDDFRELLSDLILRYNKEASARDLPFITALAEYAATGKVKQADCGVFAELTADRGFTIPYTGSSETLEAGEISLTLSYGMPSGGKLAGDICAILSPSAEQSADEFVEKAKCICREFAKKHPLVVIKAVSRDGLLSDLSFLSDGYVIDTRLFPSPSENADAVFGINPPSVLIFPRRQDLHELWTISAAYGITPTAPIASRAKLVSIRSGETSIEFSKKELEYFNKSTDVCLDSCESPVLSGEEEIFFTDRKTMNSKYTVSAVKLGGEQIYEALEKAMSDREAVYAVSGVINTSDSSLLPLIITVDSFRKNNAPSVIYSRFFVGKTTSLYVFKLAKKK